MGDAFKLAVAKLADFFGDAPTSDWRWGDLHKRRFPSLAGIAAFSSDSFEAPGTSHTVNPAYVSIWKNGQIVVSTSTGGASERFIVDFSDLNNSRSVIPAGQSGISTSSHYMDQLQMFLAGEYHVHYFGASTPELFLDQWKESTLLLIPGGV
jgi:penicillin amidase